MNTLLQNLRKPLPLLALALYLLLTLGRLVSSDCFLDGVTYAALANNLADGMGRFWSLYYTAEFPRFAAHPPLGIWLESLFFRIFGSAPGNEQAWGILLGLMSLAAVMALWSEVREQCEEPQRLPGAWWPVLLWVLSPLVPWCYTNNMLENTTAPLILFASICALRGCRNRIAGSHFLWSLTAGGLLFAALLAKGPPALFPLVLPLAAAVALRGVTVPQALRQTLWMALALAIGTSATILLGGSSFRAFLDAYIWGQLKNSMAGSAEVASSHYYLLKVLLAQLWVPLAAALLIRLCCACRRRVPAGMAGWGIFFLIMGAAGSLPFLVFPKQMEWYVMPSLPFYALGLASFLSPGAAALEASVSSSRPLTTAVRALTAVCIVCALLVPTLFRGAIKVGVETWMADAWRVGVLHGSVDDRQSEYTWKHFCEDILERRVAIPPGQSVTAMPAQVHDHYRVAAYLMRYYRVSLTKEGGKGYLLVGVKDGPVYLTQEMEPMHPAGAAYTLYHRRPNGPPAR